MKQSYFRTKKAIISLFLGVLTLGVAVLPVSQAQAAGENLIKNPSFEQGNVDTYWYLWNNNPRERSYVIYKSYDVPFGTGSHSAVIEATGVIGSLYDAGMVTNSTANPFTVNANKTYNFSFYAKGSKATSIAVYLHRADNFEPLTPSKEINVTTQWQRYQVQLTPNATASASLGIAYGSLGNSEALYLDSLDLSESNYTLSTQEVKGFIGESKNLSISGGNRLTVDDIRIELPYFNPLTQTMERKQFVPSQVSNGKAIFTMPANTFAGVGKVFVYGGALDEFNYNVYVKVTDVSPDPIRPDEDMVVYGTGFHPNLTQDFIVVVNRGENGASYEKWLAPHTVDSSLSQVVVKLPVGMLNNKLTARTYFTNKVGTSVENKSNSFSYTIQPEIYGWEWSQRGSEQVGDKITIYGKGIVDRPTVHFYNSSNEIIAKKSATIKKIVSGTENYEVIEVATPVTLNQVTITVKAGPHESDPSSALSYIAKPTIKSVTTKNARTLANNNVKLPAAKVGEKIRLIGNGFKTSSPAQVEFWSIHGAVTVVTVDPTSIDPRGNWVDVVVPVGAINGQINVKINGQKSNNFSLEIIPTIISTNPTQPVPGESVVITTHGTSLDPSQIVVRFKAPSSQEIEVQPSSVNKSGDAVLLTVMTPRALPSSGTTMTVQSGYWLDNETYRIAVAPHLDQADMNRVSKILTLRGYGFSTKLNENKLTFKYADGTVVETEHRIMSVTNTTEGQEMKIRILDDYYYGSIYITVSESRSNEVSVGPAMITRLERRVQYVQANNRVMGVLYISGRNFGPQGDVKVGDVWATTHYRTNTFIIAVVETGDLYKNPVIVTKP